MRGVYLLHLERPLSPDHTAQHYKGSAEDIEAHRRGNGSRMMQVVAERGIGFQLVRTWEVPEGMTLRQAEKVIRRQKNGRELCPLCNGQAMNHKKEIAR